MRLPRRFGALLTQLVEELGGTHEIGEEKGDNALDPSRFPGTSPVQLRIVAQHRPLQVLEGRAGLDAELVPERRPKLLVGAEGIGLAACPVEGGDSLTPNPLP